MRLHRFYSKIDIKDKMFDIPDKELVHQWKKVFRYNVGSQVILFDGSGVDYLCIISSLRNLGATVSVIREMKNNSSGRKRNVWLCISLIKKDKFEFCVEKGTEIGVNHFVPVLAERSEKKKINFERLQKISIESSEQSGRGDIPLIHETIKLEELLSGDILPNSAFYLDFSGKPIREIIKDGENKDLAVFVGPEGGWGDEEIKIFEKYNIKAVSLGEQVLRAETASIAIASLLLL